MEVRIVHQIVEAKQYPDPRWQFDPSKPDEVEPPIISNAGNDLGFADIETDNWDFETNPVEFYDPQPTKAAAKWVADYQAANPDAEKPIWPAADTKTKK